MSWWIYLKDEYGKIVRVPPHKEGATYADGGTDKAELNVTYNYGKEFKFRNLNGKKAWETEDELAQAVDVLGTRRYINYWTATPGNVGYTCWILLGWARRHPDARWFVS
jgi:hypothetical protein